MKGKGDQRLSDQEFLLLNNIEMHAGDVLIGFLFSACSVHRMENIARESAKARAVNKRKVRDELYRQKKRLKQLEKEGYVKLIGSGNEQRVSLTEEGQGTVAWRSMEILTKNKKTQIAWDGKWTVAFFDVPQEEKHVRYSLGSLLKRCGFYQTQMSVYVYPYECLELVQALAEYPTWGRYCQVMRGTYYGNDTELRKIFGLKA